MNFVPNAPAFPVSKLVFTAFVAVFITTVPPVKAAVIDGWVHRYNRVTSNGQHYASSIASDSAGDITITGIHDNSDILTIKYSGGNGSVMWQKRNGSRGYFDRLAMAVDANGNVLITGKSYSTNGTVDTYIAKYSGSDGSLLWESHYDGGEYGLVATDGGGNVVVAGSFNKNAPPYDTDYFTAKYAGADGALLWDKRYDSPVHSYDTPVAITVDANGNAIITALSYSTNGNYHTAKYAASDGTLLWEHRYTAATNVDQPMALAIDASGNVVVTGVSRTGTPPYQGDYYTAKYATADGALLWERHYNGPANGADSPRDVTVDNSGDVLVTGRSESIALGFEDPSGFDYYTAKYRGADGAILWERRYSGPSNRTDVAHSVRVDVNGDVTVLGYSQNGAFMSPDYDYHTLKYAGADGALLWEKRYGGPTNRNDQARALTLDFSGNVIVTGSSSDNYNTSEIYTAKYSSQSGQLLWDQHYNGPGNSRDEPSALAFDGAGNVVVTGTSTHALNPDYYTAKYAAGTGALLWEQRYDGAQNQHDSATAIVLDGGGNVIVTGSSYIETNKAFDYYTVKYAASNGAVLWQQRYNGPANGYDLAKALGVDGSGNVIVTGSSYNETNRANDYYTAKYAASDGAVLWEQRYNRSADGTGRNQFLVTDSSGNVIVTGSSHGGITGYDDYYTAKYASSDGALLWEKRYDGPANFWDKPRAIAVDSSGNVVVTGSSYAYNGTRNEADYYTAKYAAADGALLWDRRYNGLGDSRDEPSAVVIDGAGNVVVTGHSNYDYYTAMYAGADGMLIWERRYNGPANNDDLAAALTLDSSGNVVVTGTSSGRGVNRDYYTVKYDAKDGAVLWEKSYGGLLTDSAIAIAIDAKGNLAVTGTSAGDYATIVYWENLPPVLFHKVAAGVRISFSGIPGRMYDVQRAPTLTGPWSTISTQAAPTDGIIEYEDTAQILSTMFYRTRAQ